MSVKIKRPIIILLLLVTAFLPPYLPVIYFNCKQGTAVKQHVYSATLPCINKGDVTLIPNTWISSDGRQLKERSGRSDISLHNCSVFFRQP